MLTFCGSGRHASCLRVAQLLVKDIIYGTAGLTADEHDGGGQTLLPGAGCWQSTFPALGSNIAVLAAAVVPVIEAAIEQPWQSRGSAIVLRRRAVNRDARTLVDAVPSALVEVALAREYR
jgi:hypothetical protein